MGKGYNYFKIEEGENYKCPIDTFNQKDELTSNYVSFFYYCGGARLLQYNTTNKNYYLLNKKELEKLNFINSSSEDNIDNGIKSFSYNNGKEFVVIAITQ